MGVSAATNDTSPAAAASPQCASAGQLAAGSASCSPACSAENTAACLTLSNANRSVCDPGNFTAGCPLIESGNCLVKCLPWVETTQNDTFTFYVTPPSIASANASDWGRTVLWQNQQFLTSIGAIAVPDRIQYVSIIGGSPTRAMAKGETVNIQVALSLSGANVTNLTFANLNLADDDAPVNVSQSPLRLESLTIQNCKLTVLPIDTNALTTLTSLDLSQNAISTFTRDYSMESLRHLNLANNSLTTFDAAFPALETLDLRDNDLSTIPPNVFLFPKLQSLSMAGYLLRNPTFTWDQYWFLNNLTSLSIDGFINDATCNAENKQLLRAHVVCILDATNLVVISKASLTWYIVIPIVATAVVAIAAFSLWYCRRKRRDAKRDDMLHASGKTVTGQLTQGDDGDDVFVPMSETPHDSSAEGSSHKYAAVAPRHLHRSSGSLWSDEELLACQLRYEDIEDVTQIGTGGFAVVWLVTYRQTRSLASKRLVRDHITRLKTQDFVTEIKLNTHLDHPSIVQFVGAAWTVETDLQALFEYMAHGDLRGYLDRTRDDPSECVWTLAKVQIAVEITEALVYVHSFVPPLVHRDLKSKNVLLGEGMKAKLSDFGVSRFASEHGTMTAGVGTGKWLAPEVLSGADYDQMCDIYSLGIVLSELDTHAVPYEELKQADVATLQLVLAGVARPRFSEQCPPVIRAVADRCLSLDPDARPSAMEIAFTLRTFAKTLEGQ